MAALPIAGSDPSANAADPAATLLSRRRFLEGAALIAGVTAGGSAIPAFADSGEASADAASEVSGSGTGTSAGSTTSSPVSGTVLPITFSNISDDGADMVSMTIVRTYTASFSLDTCDLAELGVSDIGELDPSDLSWYLSRTHGYFDDVLFPDQCLGGLITDWTVVFGEHKGEPIFSIDDVAIAAPAEGDAETVTLTFTMANPFLSTDSIYAWDGSRDYMMDFVGDFELSCCFGNATIAATTVRVNPYDNFHTADELDAVLYACAQKLNAQGRYAKVSSAGLSAGGSDIPYIVIADSEESVDGYLERTRHALEDPQAVADEIEGGSDFRVPVLYSNIHPDELDGPDAMVRFLSSLVATGGKIPYSVVTDFTEEGKAEFEKEMESKKAKWSDSIADYVTGLGFISLDNMSPDDYDPVAYETPWISGPVDLPRYYQIEQRTYDLDQILKQVILIVIPTENVDGRKLFVRSNAAGFDLNRDAIFQTQPESVAVTGIISTWNPVAFVEIHGYYNCFLIEPCTPPHNPNFDIDLMTPEALKLGEAFGNGAISNNGLYNSYDLPLRDFFTAGDDGAYSWDIFCWDDRGSQYTPAYGQLHGTMGITVECPYCGDQAVAAYVGGICSHSATVATDAKQIYQNQLATWKRGVDGEDASGIRSFLVDSADTPGAEADLMRPVSEENNSYFPEYYVIPLDPDSQHDTGMAADMVGFLLHNGIKVSLLTGDADVGDATYHAGDIVIDMHQAKRNVVASMFSKGYVCSGWYTLYGSAVTYFPETMGFTCDEVRVAGAFDGILADQTLPITVSSVLEGEGADEGTAADAGTGAAVILSNSTTFAVHAVNDLLASGQKVGFITSGDRKGDFVISEDVFQKVRGSYVLHGALTDAIPDAELIDNLITLRVADLKADTDDRGLYDYDDINLTDRMYDVYALRDMMGFTLVDDLVNASQVVGCQPLTEDELAAVKAGMPYVCYGPDALGTTDTTSTYYVATSLLNAFKDIGIVGLVTERPGANVRFDALFHTEYPTDDLVTAVYVAEGAKLMYGLGGTWFSGIPEGADVLIRNTSEEPVAGYFPASELAGFLNADGPDGGGNIQAFRYTDGKLNLTCFANNITRTCFQTAYYRYISNAIFANALTGEKFSL